MHNCKHHMYKVSVFSDVGLKKIFDWMQIHKHKMIHVFYIYRSDQQIQEAKEGQYSCTDQKRNNPHPMLSVFCQININ